MTETDPLSKFRLDDRVVLITGASSGLGQRFARVAAAAGAAVVVGARRRERLDSLVDELPDALAVEVDLTAVGSVERLIGEATGRYGRVDVLVNNAGVSTAVAALDFTAEDFRREIEIDLVVPYALSRAVAAAAISDRRPASVINVGSVLGTVGGGKLRVPGYAAAKGGLHNLTRELASEWARKGVRVNAIAPGWFPTEMAAEMFEGGRAGAYIEDNTPMGRAGELDELDGVLLFLAGDASTFVTGQIIHVDGGWTAV